MKTDAMVRLKSLLEGSNAAPSDQGTLEHFLKHCARRRLMMNGRQVPLPLQTLLVRWPYLQSEVKIAAETFIQNQWQRMCPEVVAVPQTEAQPASATQPEPLLSVNDASPGFAAPPAREDWFDRFLNGVRVLLFL